MAYGKQSPGLVVDIRPGERLSITGAATVEVVHKSGQFARLRVVADRDVSIKKEPAQDDALRVPSMAAYTC